MPGKKPKKTRRGSETGFILPEDGLHKTMAALPWPVLREMLFPRPRAQLKVVSSEPEPSADAARKR